MVLQRGVKVPVWGTGAEGEKVTVTFAGQTKEATVKDGKWRVDLDPLKASATPAELVVKGANEKKISDVLVGEVWICSGQSNMAWTLSNCDNAQEEISNANHPTIRLLTVGKKMAAEPMTNFSGKWTVCTPQTAKSFSGVGYFFGRDLQAALKVPIGLINSSWGGTQAEAWTPNSSLKMLPDWDERWKKYEDNIARADELRAAFRAQTDQWKKDRAEKKKGTPARGPRAPLLPDNPVWPSNLYNGMIAPLQPFAIQGVIWYQGESNTGDPSFYYTLFPEMIRSWRQTWGQGDFPFLFVQLAPHARDGLPDGVNVAGIREAQRRTLDKVPNTAMVVTTDVGNPGDVHPRKKEPVGQRLALAAQSLAYGSKTVYSGPNFSKITIDGSKAILHFHHVGGGLVALDDGKLRGFFIAAADKVFYPAEAVIEGDKIVVSSPNVSEPVAVRFGYKNVPDVNLWNKDGLPASPFRTDNFDQD